ncbi:MAG: hypothetical protein II928_05475, partial [Paludibacteraceae bacterium]|nr:hypothetical protein [Paludibacteraceae bacterium]
VSLTCRSFSTESVRYMDDCSYPCLWSHAGLWGLPRKNPGAPFFMVRFLVKKIDFQDMARSDAGYIILRNTNRNRHSE